jgi:hypothetical protein
VQIIEHYRKEIAAKRFPAHLGPRAVAVFIGLVMCAA